MRIDRKTFYQKLLLIGVVFILTACAQPAVIANSGNEAILQELQQIRTLLERIEKNGLAAPAQKPARATTAQVSTKGRPALGAVDAPITIVEISDYQCPYCKRFADNTLPQLKEEYVDTGKARLVFMDLPLSFHQHSLKAAQAARCAGDQGKYWEMHDQLFTNVKRLEEKYLLEYAGLLALDQNEFTVCLNSEKHLEEIDRDAKEASQAGITGTPSFVIGKTTADLITGIVVRGAQPFASLKITLDGELKNLLKSTP